MPEIREINHGMCSRVGDTVYVNRKLKDHPSLYQKLLVHESRHSSSMTFKDVLIDVDNYEIGTVRSHYYRFMFTHPSSLTILLPVWYMDGDIIFDFNMSLLWGFAIAIFLAVFFLAF